MTELKEIPKNNSHLPTILLLGGKGIILTGLGFVMKTFGGTFITIGVVIGTCGLVSLLVTVVGVFAFYAPQYINEGTIRQ